MTDIELTYKLLQNMYILLLLLHIGLFCIIYVYFSPNIKHLTATENKYLEFVNKTRARIRRLKCRVACLETWVDDYTGEESDDDDDEMTYEITGAEMDIPEKKDDESDDDCYDNSDGDSMDGHNVNSRNSRHTQWSGIPPNAYYLTNLH
jgi:hypothetical protein